MNKEEIKNLLYALHHSTYRNEQQIKNSKDCGCFHCKTIFKPEDVTDWCDNDGRGDRTGRCPNCRMDSVLCDNSGVDITREFRPTGTNIIQGSFRSQTSNQSATKTSPYCLITSKKGVIK